MTRCGRLLDATSCDEPTPCRIHTLTQDRAVVPFVPQSRSDLRIGQVVAWHWPNETALVGGVGRVVTIGENGWMFEVSDRRHDDEPTSSFSRVSDGDCVVTVLADPPPELLVLTPEARRVLDRLAAMVAQHDSGYHYTGNEWGSTTRALIEEVRHAE